MTRRLLRFSGQVAVASLAISLLTAAGVAQAQRHERYEHMDGRYAHNHYYPSRGYVVGVVPQESVVVTHFRDRYYYAGGVWYAPRGPRFVVVAPPVGLFVPVLPPFYTTLWFGGAPYYYANDAYYVWRESERQYEVVAPPDGGGNSATTQAPVSEDLYIYPKNGQSEEQQAKDRYECHRWAQSQSGFDPTQSGGGVPPDQAPAKRTDYNRAMGACLEGRGYTVK